MSAEFQQKIRKTLADANLQAAVYTATGRLKQKRKDVVGPAALPDYQELRDQAHAIKKHTLENLDYYLEQFEAKVEAHGGKVVWCKDGAEVADFVLAPGEGARGAADREIEVDDQRGDRLQRAPGARADSKPWRRTWASTSSSSRSERPYHIVAPALHMTRYDVADLFTRRLGVPEETVIEKQTMIARAVLREKFLAADIGVSGANFLVADSGAVVLVENEGNIRLTTSAPKIHIAVAGIEKLIPRAQDLAVFLKLLGRSGTGQPLTVYTSFLSGPRRAGEIDGPDEFYVVLLDNGRTRLLADREKRQSLYCIRCGACLNTCPVYRKIGGHSYPWVYSGPIGAIITPQYLGVKHEPWLPFASSLCGACAEVCPVKIDIPQRAAGSARGREEVGGARERRAAGALGFRAWAWVMRHPRIYEMLGMTAGAVLQSENGWVKKAPALMSIPPLAAWLSQRDLPPAPARSFRQMWRRR